MGKTFDDLLEHLKKHIEYLEEDLAGVDMKEEPSTYWYVFSGIECYKAIAKKIEEEYL